MFQSCARHDTRDVSMTDNIKNRKYIFYLWLVLCFFFSTYANGQATNQIIIEADSITKFGQPFKITYQCLKSNSKEKIISPKWDWENYKNDFVVLSGPDHHTSHITNINNGVLTNTYKEGFTFVLSFNREGKYSMPIMKAKTDSGKKLSSTPFVVCVTKDEIPSKNTDMFVIETSVNKNHIILGDSIEYEIRLYTDLNVHSIHQSPTQINAAHWEELNPSNKLSYERASYEGKSVNSILLSKKSIVPIQEGEITIEPIKFTIVYYKRSEADPFEIFLNGSLASKDTTLTTAPTTIYVENNFQKRTNGKRIKR